MLRSLLFVWVMCFALSAQAQEPEPADPETITAAEPEVAEPGKAAEIQAAFARVGALSGVTATWGDGVVVLSGEVVQTQDRSNAEAIASKFADVLFVDNQITVSTQAATADDPTANDAAIRERLERVFANVAELGDVKVDVHAGVVKLSGTVLNSSAAANAESLARATDGAIYVENVIAEETAVSERISPALARTRDILGTFLASLPLLGVGLGIIVAFILLGGFITKLSFPFRRIEDKPLILGIVKQVVRLVITGVGVILVLELFDLTGLVGAIVGGAGVAGIAFGFAFKDIAENYLASIMLSIRRPFEKDDWVLVGELEGKVVRLTTRETVLMTLDGNHLRVPNARVFQSVITNYTRNPMRRIGFAVGVGVGENISGCLTIGTATLAATRGVAEEPRPLGIVESLGDFTVNLRFFVWINQEDADYFTTKSESIRRLKLAFDHAGIDMPEPTRRVMQTAWSPPAAKPLPELAMPAHEQEAVVEQLTEQIEEDRKSSDEADLL